MAIGFFLNAFAQESTNLLLMNGKEITVFEFDDSSQTVLTYKYDKNYFKRERKNLREARKAGIPYSISYQSEKGNAIPVKLKNGNMDRTAVFSASKDSTEQVFYYFDEPIGNDLKVEEMRAFVVGERDARYGVRGRFWLVSGFVVGALSGYALEGAVYSLAVPPLFALSAQLPVVKIDSRHISDKQYYENENYAAGYESTARSKNTRQALKGSVLGLLVGIVSYAIVDNNR